jgi:hypothetical protein
MSSDANSGMSLSPNPFSSLAARPIPAACTSPQPLDPAAEIAQRAELRSLVAGSSSGRLLRKGSVAVSPDAIEVESAGSVQDLRCGDVRPTHSLCISPAKVADLV